MAACDQETRLGCRQFRFYGQPANWSGGRMRSIGALSAAGSLAHETPLTFSEIHLGSTLSGAQADRKGVFVMSVRKKKQAMSDEELQKFLSELPPPTWREIQALRNTAPISTAILDTTCNFSANGRTCKSHNHFKNIADVTPLPILT
jgi:hypothetical protein